MTALVLLLHRIPLPRLPGFSFYASPFNRIQEIQPMFQKRKVWMIESGILGLCLFVIWCNIWFWDPSLFVVIVSDFQNDKKTRWHLNLRSNLIIITNLHQFHFGTNQMRNTSHSSLSIWVFCLEFAVWDSWSCTCCRGTGQSESTILKPLRVY